LLYDKVGLPESREQYIHRLGRTGRAGKRGKSLLVLAPFEKIFLSELQGLDVDCDYRIQQLLSEPADRNVTETFERNVLDRVFSDDVLKTSAEQAYQAFLGYYAGQLQRVEIKSKEDLVAKANHFSRLIGLRETPFLSKRVAVKMGVEAVRGIRLKDQIE